MIKLKKIFFFILVTLFFYESVNGAIKDSLFATVGSKAITRSDIINEIKIILILNGQSFADQDKEKIEALGCPKNISDNDISELCYQMSLNFKY